MVTADAMHTQTKTARYIAEDKKADYLLARMMNPCKNIDTLL